MKVIYLGHSGFLLEWEHSYWLFDYFEGDIPELNLQKEILVFCSHTHEDHFSPSVLDLSDKYPSVTYIFSDELQDTCKEFPEIHFLKSGTVTSFTTPLGENLQIHTLQSTDCGCAFFIEYNGKNIYHAGDLHWWYWEGEDISWNKQMTIDFKKEMEYLNGKNIDLAFVPLDPRQGKEYAWGINYFLECTHTGHLFPMHFWNDFAITEHYEQEYPVADGVSYHIIHQNGQIFEIMI